MVTIWVIRLSVTFAIALLCGCPQNSRALHINASLDSEPDSISLNMFRLAGSATQSWAEKVAIRLNAEEKTFDMDVRLMSNKNRIRFWGELEYNGNYYSGLIFETENGHLSIRKGCENQTQTNKYNADHAIEIGTIKRDETGIDVRNLASSYTLAPPLKSFQEDSVSRAKGLRVIISGFDTTNNAMVLDTLSNVNWEDYSDRGLNVFLLHPCGWYFPLKIESVESFDPLAE